MKKLKNFLTGIIIAAVVTPCLYTVPVQAKSGVKIDSNNFPDANFRAVIAGRTYDQDGDGYLSDYEISHTRNIKCEYKNISSLQGIEYFTDLQGLWCKHNNLTSLDVSKNTDLRGIWCSYNNLTSLDLSNNRELTWVYCHYNKITSLDFSDNPHMAYVECNSNPLEELILTENEELVHLMCGDCGLYELDLSGNPNLTHLDAFKNHLSSIDVTDKPYLKRLNVWFNQELGSIDVSHNPELQTFSCAYIQAYDIDVSHNPHLRKLTCSYNRISDLDLSHNPELVYLDCASNWLDDLDLSHNPQLFFLQAFTNDFTTLDIGNNPNLIKTYNDGKCVDEYDVCDGHSWTIDYGEDLFYFLCFDDSVTLKTTSSNPVYAVDSYINYDDGYSSSDDFLTREAAIQVLYEMAGKPSVSGKSRFSDVKSGAWYEKAVIWGEKNNIAFGYPDIACDTFGVGELITREDLCLMIHRYAIYEDYSSALDYGRTDDFKDFLDISYHSWDAVTWAIQFKILIPKGQKDAPNSQLRICPQGRVKRSELKPMLETLLELNYESGSIPSVHAAASVPYSNQWVKALNKWYYYTGNGKKATGWYQVGKWWYYFDSRSIMMTGWQEINGKWYYLRSSGEMATGWVSSGGKWYYMDSEGAMSTGWICSGGKWYYMKDSGVMFTGWLQSGSKWYYLGNSGEMATGWRQVGNYWYYFESSGAMITGWRYSGDAWYYFDGEGRMVTGNRKIDGKNCKFGNDGKWLGYY